MEDTELKPELYFIDSDGEYHKCHKLLPDIRRIFGEIEVMNGKLVEVTPTKLPEIDTYYGRSLNEDGTFQKQSDTNNQKHVAEMVRKTWNAEVTEYGKTDPIDYFIKRGDRECFADCKTAPETVRDHALLNVRKFCCLMDVGRLWNVPTFLFLYDPSGIYYVKAQELGDPIECGKRIAGFKRMKAQADIEPCLKIYKKDMARLV